MLTKIAYIAIRNNSNVNRTDILITNADLESVRDIAYKDYYDFYKNYGINPENELISKSEFLEQAESKMNSAYIQYPDHHINYEIHTVALPYNQF